MITELARVQTDAQLKMYEEGGFEYFKFHTLGAKACPICRALDGKVFKVKDMLISENAPPMHPNCHCSTSATVPEDSPRKMAKEEQSANDWSEAIPQQISKYEKRKIVAYSKNKGINLIDMKYFDGKTELLKSTIDRLSDLKEEFGISRRLTIRISKMKDCDFAETKKHTITINRMCFRNKDVTEKNISSGNFASKSIEDIVSHEFGHIYSKKVGKFLDIAHETY